MAPEGVLRHVHLLGDSPRRCLADGGVCVCVCLLLVRARAKRKGIKYGATRSVPKVTLHLLFFFFFLAGERNRDV